MAAVWTCQDTTCGRTVDTKSDACPKCGGAMKKIGESPIRAWAAIVCGVLLIGLMGTILLALGPALNQTVATGSSENFTGTAEQAQAVLHLFYVVIAFGVLALVNGIYMLVTGSQHRAFIIVTLLMVLVLFYVLYRTFSLLSASA
ncbi:MAG: hypothetical protein KF780_00645 [Sphingomonas sp.]|nr:hypothetical protein [Sphingomonas sp.]